MELHALFDLVCPGLLGERAAFRAHFERPITAGSDKARRRMPGPPGSRTRACARADASLTGRSRRAARDRARA
jgi:SNF2 family DNA or RNA helicase